MINRSISLGIRFYRYFFSPFLGRNCRFHPSCSTYALQAVEYYGFWRGLTLALKRVLRCHPGHPGGSDPLP